MGQPLYCSPSDAGVWGMRETMVMAPPPIRDSAVSPCFHGAWFSSTGICHHNLLPHIPSIRLSAVNSSPHLGIAPQSLNSSSQLLRLQGTLVPVKGMYGCSKDCLILIPCRLPQISCSTLSLKCFSSDSDNCPAVGIRPLLQFSHPLRAGPVLLTLLFSPQFLHPTEFCVGLFHWSGSPVCCQLMFCMHFCV